MTRANVAPPAGALAGAVRAEEPTGTFVAGRPLPEPTKNVGVAVARGVARALAMTCALDAIYLGTLRVAETPGPSVRARGALRTAPESSLHALEASARLVDLADTTPVAR